MTTVRGQRPGSRLRVAMVGPARTARSGIAAVARAHLNALPDGAPAIRYITTQIDGPKIVKALTALVGAVRFAATLVFWRAQIAHVHMSSWASYHRKAAFVRIAKALGRAVVIHIHGSEFHVFHGSAKPALAAEITRILESADLVIALSNEWHDRLSTIAPRAVRNWPLSCPCCPTAFPFPPPRRWPTSSWRAAWVFCP